MYRVPKYLRKAKPRKLCLMAKCREVIRRHLLRNSTVNLFVRVPQIGLPSLLTDYLLYNVSLDSDSTDGDNDYYDEGDDDDTSDDSDDDNDDINTAHAHCQSWNSADDDDDMDSDGRCRRASRTRTLHSYGLSNFCYRTDSDSDEYDDSDDSYGPAPFRTYRR